MLDLFLFLVAAHALCDYPLQGDFLAKLKQPGAIPGRGIWLHGLVSHSMIHGGAVALLTGSWWLGMAEAVLHGITDHAKCRGWLSYHGDQLVHVVCKVAWAMIAGGAAWPA